MRDLMNLVPSLVEASMPTFTTPLQNLTIPVGRNATFTCNVRHIQGYKVRPDVTSVSRHCSWDWQIYSRCDESSAMFNGSWGADLFCLFECKNQEPCARGMARLKQLIDKTPPMCLMSFSLISHRDVLARGNSMADSRKNYCTFLNTITGTTNQSESNVCSSVLWKGTHE